MPENDPVETANRKSQSSDIERNRITNLEIERTSLVLRAVRAERQFDAARAETVEVEGKLSEIESRLAESEKKRRGLERGSHSAIEELEKAQAELSVTLDKIERLRRRSALLEEQRNVAREQAARTKQTLAFQLGQMLVSGFTTWRGFIHIPRNTISIIRQSRHRRRTKRENQLSRSQTVPEKKTLASSGETAAAAPAAASPAIRTTGHENPARLQEPLDRKLRIASVMDEFTEHSYAPESDLLQLHPENWLEQLSAFSPDLLFIESAWKGLDDLWKLKISNPAEEILEAIQWCRNKQIPVMFWNKEDPVHFDTFLPIASQADYVFTTDVDCIAKYKYRLGHDRVYLLPFAAQPARQNPIETYDRKDAFNFAGSYYLRYPERQRDFDTLIEAAGAFRPVEIFDRNFEKPHAHYMFPEKYSDMILGSLDFSEIDRAYKGYRFGINMNTIKQSQTMFARRVFELLASNTIAVSNFSRGVRLLFGDTVIATDNAVELRQRIQAVCEEPTDYRKFRLLGLRRVMREHTYAHRLAYISAKLAGISYRPKHAAIVVAGIAHSEEECQRLIEQFDRQSYQNKRLHILTKFPDFSIMETDGRQFFADTDRFTDAVEAALSDNSFFAFFHVEDHYGPEYLHDLVLTDAYSNADAFGKAAFYVGKKKTCVLDSDGAQYRPSEHLLARSSLVRSPKISKEWLKTLLANPDEAELTFDSMLAIDEFHYCRDASDIDPDRLRDLVEDLPIANQGASLENTIYPTAENISAPVDVQQQAAPGDSTALREISGSKLCKILRRPASTQLSLTERDGMLDVVSTIPHGEFAYVYSSGTLTREECNFVLDSRFQVEIEGDLNVRTVFEFQDEYGKKISHSINPAGHKVSLPIPAHCRKLRFGLRIQGSGKARIRRLAFGGMNEKPSLILGSSDTLVLTRQYPDHDNLYRYGFLHSRVRGYRQRGTNVDIFRLEMTAPERHFWEFEGVDIATGDAALLEATLESGQYRHVLVHLLNSQTWDVLRKHAENMKITVWVHGSEIQPYHRREYNMVGLSDTETSRQKVLSEQRMEFWRGLLADIPDNLNLVFVSKYLAEEVMEDIGFPIPPDKYSVIHNPIDTDLFGYQAKKPEHRHKILSIRPFKSRVYANDLTIAAINALRDEPFFSDLEFRLIGDGELFDETVAPVRDLPNVKLEKKFLHQSEIAEIHKEYGVFLVPSRSDTQGVSRDEAMSSGLVPITNRVAAVPEFVDESSALLCDPEDAEGLARAIQTLHEHPDMFQRLSEAASARVRRQSGADLVLASELALIRKC